MKKSTKPMTHVGTATEARYNKPIEVQLRETATRWYSEKGTWWPKEARYPNASTVYESGTVSRYHVRCLDLCTVRPLTTAELRVPLQRRLDWTDTSIAQLTKQRDELEQKIRETIDTRAAAEEALRQFNADHADEYSAEE